MFKVCVVIVRLRHTEALVANKAETQFNKRGLNFIKEAKHKRKWIIEILTLNRKQQTDQENKKGLNFIKEAKHNCKWIKKILTLIRKLNTNSNE